MTTEPTIEERLRQELGKSEKMGDKIDCKAVWERFVTGPTSKLLPTKELKGLKTFTFLDNLYLKDDNTPLDGIPLIVQLGVVGLSGTGKSLLAQEVVLQVANKGGKVVFVTSEDVWMTENERRDLQSRMKAKADALGLDWEKIKSNVFILDATVYSELREWDMFSSVYRSIVESSPEQITLLVIDSITLMESYRAALKNRVLELSRFNQTHGITGLYVCQRGDEETDKFSISGGIGVAHNLDSVLCIDIGKASGQLKDQFGVKQWDLVHFLRVLSCRLCSFDRKYMALHISSDGFLRIDKQQ